MIYKTSNFKIKTLLIYFNAALLFSVSLPIYGATQVAAQKTANACECQTVAQVQLKWTTDIAELKKAETLFVDAFADIYNKIPLTKFGNIKAENDTKAGHEAAINKFLNKAFSDQVNALQKNAVDCVIAYADGKVVGFATFEKTKNPGEIYIDQLAVDIAYQSKGIGKQLVFSITNHHKDIKKLVVITRKVNEVAKAFYHKLGFKNSTYMHPDYNPELYVGYEMELARK